MNSIQQQTNFEASCGTEIFRETIRIRMPWRKRVWLASGQVMDKFDNDVMPEIEAILQTEDPGYAEYYFSVVMVGLRPATAKPKILVSCTNSDVRTEVLRIIKSSHHIRDTYPEFGFGESSVPLHEPMPSVPLAGKVKSKLRTTPQDDVPSTRPSLEEYRVGEVLASDPNPAIGRKLFVSSAENEPTRYATGGIVVRIGDKYYQKTVGHIDESECGPISQCSPDDIGYCRFDDDSDDEDDDMFQFDSDITSRGSMTPEDNLSQADSFDGSDTASFGLTAGPSSTSDRWRYPQSESVDAIDVAHQSSPSDDGIGALPGLTNVGRLVHNSRAGKKPGLDYALVRLNDTFDPEKANRICVDPNTNMHVQIMGVEPIAAVERDIVTVTASGGIARGKIMPSAVYFRSPSQRSFQKLYVVRLSTVVVDGDCGADVVDANTGNLYGHVVRGCRGTQTAYIVSAKDVFEDLEDRLGIAPEMVFPDQTEDFAKRGTTPGQELSREPLGMTIQFPKNIRQALDQTLPLVRMFTELPKAITFLHGRHDIKPCNTLIMNQFAPNFMPADFGLGRFCVSRKAAQIPSFNGPTFRAVDEPHVSEASDSDSSRLQSTANTHRSRKSLMVFSNESHVASRGSGSSAELIHVAQMSRTDYGRRLLKLASYTSRDKNSFLEGTEKWTKSMIVPHLRREQLEEFVCRCCDDPISGDQRSDLHPMINFRHRLDHVWGHIRFDDSSEGLTAPAFAWASLTCGVIADSSCPNEGGTIILGRKDQINLLSILSGLENIWQDRLWVLQEKSMASTFSRASEVLRGTDTSSSIGFQFDLQSLRARHFPSKLDTFRNAITHILQCARLDAANHPTGRKLDAWAVACILMDTVAWYLCDESQERQFWRTIDYRKAMREQTDCTGGSRFIHTRAPDKVTLPSWIPIWRQPKMSDIFVSHLPGMEDTGSYHGAVEFSQCFSQAYIAKPAGRRRNHRSNHRSNHMCLLPECESKSSQKFSDLQRHRKQIHQPENHAKQFNCHHTRCKRSAEPFHRVDHFRDHYRECHKEDHSPSLLSPELRRLMGDENMLMIMIWFSRFSLLKCPHGPWWSDCPDCPWYCPDCFYCPQNPRCSCCERPDEHGNEICPVCAECPHCLEA